MVLRPHEDLFSYKWEVWNDGIDVLTISLVWGLPRMLTLMSGNTNQEVSKSMSLCTITAVS